MRRLQLIGSLLLLAIPLSGGAAEGDAAVWDLSEIYPSVEAWVGSSIR